ncbi:MAG: amidohydrolase [Acidimicrobiales bacterium]|nr:amidohydrolase [Acidimicrobiales bacterium]
MNRSSARQQFVDERLDKFLAAHEEELVAFRRQLHAHPELSWEEHETTALVNSRLSVAGLEPRALDTETGLVLDLGDPATGPTVALRADMDALPLDDEKDVPYRSTVPGACHACGHDVHTAILLGTTLALADLLPDLDPAGRLRLIFQPAEEAMPGGADHLSKTDLMDGVDVIYAVHCDPSLEVGKVGMRVGPITAAADRIIITLHGPGGHTARPHLTADLVHIAGRIICDLPAGFSKLSDLRDAPTLVFGAVQAGHAANVIPSTAVLKATLRSQGRATWDQAPAIIETLLASIVDPFGATYELDYVRGSPPTDNDEQATAVFADAARLALGPDSVVPTAQSVGNEDFSWFLDRAPGSYARLGVRPPDATRKLDLHASSFDVDEASIGLGVRLLTHTALRALAAYGDA